MKKLFVIAVICLVAYRTFAASPVPRDQNNTPIYSGTGRPFFSEAVTLTGTTYVTLLTLPTTGENENRNWKGIMVRNPDAAIHVYVCLGDTTGCTQDAFKIPATLGLAIDSIYFGPINSVSRIWGKLSTNGSVTPELTIW